MSEPVHIGDATLYRGDCLDILPTLEADSIDLTVTSPPYDNLRTAYDSVDTFAVIEQLYRVTKPGGVVMWNVADATVNGSETGTSFRQVLHAMKIGFNLHDTMIYARREYQFPQTVRYPQTFEYMFIFSKGAPTTVNLIKDRQLAYPNQLPHGHRIQKDGSRKQIPDTTKRVGNKGPRLNVWYIKPSKNDGARQCNEHPATMPYSMARDHIRTWSNPGDTILDPMMGSATTGLACIELDCKFIGIEKKPEYFELARERLRQERAQVKLFDSESPKVKQQRIEI